MSSRASHDRSLRQYLRLVVLGGLIGIPAAVLAVLVITLVHTVEDALWHGLPGALGVTSPPWYLVVGLPVVGAAVVLAARTLLPGDGGHEPLQGIGGGATPVRNIAGVVLAAVGTLSFGAVLGPEAPVIAVGSAVGVAVTALARTTERDTAILSQAGSFSAMSALFGGPLVAGLLLVEGGVGLGASLLPTLLPGLVAAAVGYVIFLGFGTWSGLDAPGLTVPDLPAYPGLHLPDVVIGLVVGVVTAVLLAGVRRGARAIEGVSQGTTRRTAIMLLSGGLMIGVLAWLAGLLGANPLDVLFSGRSSVPALLAAGSTTVIVVTLVAKLMAYAISLGCGFRGGPIFPAIFVGVALATLPIVWFDGSPTLALAVGAAAGMAAQTRLLFAPLLFSSLLVGHNGSDTISAVVIASVAAWLMTAVLSRDESRSTSQPDSASSAS